MLTILMQTLNNEAELAHTLSTLVAGAVEGVVSDVIILDHGSADGSARVADAAGARFVTQWDMGDVVRSARGEWFLLLEPGARPAGRWIDDLAEYMALGRVPARFSPSRLHRRPPLQRLLRRASPLEYGLLLRRQQAEQAVRPDMRLEDFAVRRKAHRLVSELVPAWVTIGSRP